MQSVLVIPKNIEEYIILTEFLKSKNLDSYELSLEEKEDLGLLQLMNEADRNKRVPRENIMSILD
jgi:hypothetical protein